MTKKSLALSKGGFALASFITYLAFCAFFFTYGRIAIENGIDKLQNQPAPEGQINLSGIGPAFLFALSLVPLICFALPELLFMISFIGNFKKKGSTKGFTVVSLVAEILGLVVLGFLSVFFLGAAQYEILSTIVMAAFDLLVFISFIQSIVVLAKHKKAKAE